MKNIGWQYYRDYYAFGENGINDAMLKNFEKNGKLEEKEKAEEQFFYKKNNALLKTTFDAVLNNFFIEKKVEEGQDNYDRITLTTNYPGLVIGSGYGHQTGTKGEFKLGFFFDHTTGLPVIPGSSVKGTLRSFFPNFEKADNPLKIKKTTPKQKAKAAYIYALWRGEEFTTALYEKYVDDDKVWLSVHRLELAIFEGIQLTLTAEKTIKLDDPEPSYLPITKRDIFHDAFIISGGKDNKILGDDNITPHGKDPLKNPTPVAFMKILPEVSFQFNFDLKETDFYSQKRKYELFKKILETNGIGAKTNVGYGQFKTEEIGQSDSMPNVFAKFIQKGPFNAKKPYMMEAVITKSGTPNIVSVYVNEGNITENVRLDVARNPIPVGTVVIVETNIINNKANRASFKGEKLK